MVQASVARERIVADAAVQSVSACSTNQHVIAVATVQLNLACERRSIHQIIAGATG